MKLQGITTLLQVFDMPRSVAFYCEVIGFQLLMTSEPKANRQFDWAMLKLGDANLMLNTAYEDHERPPAPDPSRIAAHADTTLYFSCSQVDDVYAHLCSNGCEAQPPITTHYDMRQVYAQDPDGYALCFQHPVESSENPAFSER